MENNDVIIKVENVYKNFKVYLDKGYSLKERALFWKRNRYEHREILKDISFEVKKGESVGLIGRNGCGKSTMLKMLTKIYYPNSGKISIKGRVSSLIELGAGFHPDMSGRENIYINASIFGLTRKEIDNRLQSIIEFSELHDYIDNPVRTYSSGMYMRLAFSVAINVDADILLIDEILAVGDANFQSKCFNKLKELKAKGITIVLVTHSIQSIIDFCDKCIWIENGKIMSYGDTNDITNKYIQYMVDERVMRSLNEQDRNMINIEVKRKKEEELKQAEEERIRKQREYLGKNNAFGLDKTADHYGVGYAILTDVYLLNEKKKRTTALVTGKPFDIVMLYKVNKKTDGLVFGMGFNSIDKKNVLYGTNTKIDNVKLVHKDKGKVVFHCEALTLQKGEYYLNVSIIDNNDLPLDFYNAYCKILVVSGEKSIGQVMMDHSWKSEK